MKLNKMLLASGMAITLFLGASDLFAQNGGGGGGNGGGAGGGRQRGNFDPAQMQQRMMDRYKETLEITDETEWNAIKPLVQKVMDARMTIGFGGRGMMGRGNRPGQPAAAAPAGMPTNVEADALQKAIDAKASSAEMKTAIQKYTDARKVKQAALEKAQADLRKVLTPRQEALGTLNGLL